MEDKATLKCIDLYKDGVDPKYRLTYKDKEWDFRAGNRGAASQQARWFLDVLVFGRGNPKWCPEIDAKRIKYTWMDT